MFLPIPEVQPSPVLTGSDIFQVESLGIGIGSAPFAADHNVMARLVPEVIVETHAIGLVFPAPRDVEILVEQQEAPGSLALAIAKHRDHHMTIRQAVHGMGSGQIYLLLYLFRLDDLV